MITGSDINIYDDIIGNLLEGCQILNSNWEYVYLNDSVCKSARKKKEELLGNKITDIYPGIEKTEMFAMLEKCRDRKISDTMENKFIYPDGEVAWFQLSVQPFRDGVLVLSFDITEQKLAEEINNTTIQIFEIINTSQNLKELIQRTTQFLYKLTDCESIGIRITQGHDFPYYSTRGFSNEFVEAENHLCRQNEAGEIQYDGNGQPSLECTCGKIIRGIFDPELPFFTKRGNFWTNNTTEIINKGLVKNIGKDARNRCVHEGYESIALIALRVGDVAYGLLQFNDRRTGLFNKEKINMLETCADNLASAIAHWLSQEAIHHTEEKYRITFQQAAVGIYHENLSGELLLVNKKFCDITGYNENELLRKKFSDLTFPDDIEEGVILRKKLLNRELNYFSREKRYLRKTGEIIWVNINIAIVFSANNKPAYFVNVVEDITDKKRAAERISRLSKIYHSLSETNKTIVRAENEEILFSRICEILLQFENFKIVWIGLIDESEEKIIPFKAAGELSAGLNNIKFPLNSDDPRANTLVSSTIRNNQTTITADYSNDVNNYYWTKNNARGVISAISLPIHLNKKVIGVLSIGAAEPDYFDGEIVNLLEEMAMDISYGLENLAKTRQIKAEEMKIKSMLNSPFLFIGLLDTQGRIVMINNSVLMVTNCTEEELKNIYLWDVPWLKHNINEKQKIKEAVLRCIEGENSRFESSFTTPDSVIRNCDFAIQSVKDENGKVIWLVPQAIDITEQKKLEEKFLQSQKLEAVGQLASGIAHDFNNMLAAIMGYSEFILMTLKKEDPVYSKIEQIIKCTEKAGNLTHQLLAFSRKQILETKVFNLNHVISEFELMLKRIISENILLKTNLSSTPATIKADKGQTEQIIMNLVVNARDAMPNGGLLEIKTEKILITQGNENLTVGEYVLLSVVDNGNGIDKETMAHIFEPFFTTKEPGKGTGLGLSTVYGIVSQSGGFIDCKSEPGKGTTFMIYFPACDEETEKIITVKTEYSKEYKNATILLVEDDEVLRNLTTEILENFGYKVIKARNADEALFISRAYKSQITLLITDVIMPGMSGKELVDTIKNDNPELKYLYISGYTNDEILRQGIIYNEFPFLQKPYGVKALIEKVHSLID